MSNMLLRITTCILPDLRKKVLSLTFSIILYGLKSTDKNKLCNQQIDSMVVETNESKTKKIRIRKRLIVSETTKLSGNFLSKFKKFFSTE